MIPIINHIVAIHCVNTVTNGTWIWMNYSDTCEKNIIFVIFVMQTVQINFMRNYHNLHTFANIYVVGI